MKTMKKIFGYIILLIIIYLVVQMYVYFLTKTNYKDMNNYEIIENIPVIIEVTESKVAKNKNKGYIEGTVTNNTGELIDNIKVKFDFYNEQGKQVGLQCEEIKTFNATEKVKFDIKYEYENVAKIEISVITE